MDAASVCAKRVFFPQREDEHFLKSMWENMRHKPIIKTSAFRFCFCSAHQVVFRQTNRKDEVWKFQQSNRLLHTGRLNARCKTGLYITPLNRIMAFGRLHEFALKVSKHLLYKCNVVSLHQA